MGLIKFLLETVNEGIEMLGIVEYQCPACHFTCETEDGMRGHIKRVHTR